MASIASEEIVVDAAVSSFLRTHAAEVEFQKVAALARAYFPELLSIDVAVQDDPDDEGRAKAVVRVRLPASFPDETFRSALRRYHERLVEELPLSRCPLFALVTEFGPK
jgi:hypothetical protein